MTTAPTLVANHYFTQPINELLSTAIYTDHHTEYDLLLKESQNLQILHENFKIRSMRAHQVNNRLMNKLLSENARLNKLVKSRDHLKDQLLALSAHELSSLLHTVSVEYQSKNTVDKFNDGDDDIEVPMAPGPNYNEARIKLVDSYAYTKENKKKESNRPKDSIKQLNSETTTKMLEQFLSEKRSILEKTSSDDENTTYPEIREFSAKRRIIYTDSEDDSPQLKRKKHSLTSTFATKVSSPQLSPRACSPMELKTGLETAIKKKIALKRAHSPSNLKKPVQTKINFSNGRLSLGKDKKETNTEKKKENDDGNTGAMKSLHNQSMETDSGQGTQNHSQQNDSPKENRPLQSAVKMEARPIKKAVKKGKQPFKNSNLTNQNKVVEID